MYQTVMIIDDSELQRYITETIVKRRLPADQVVCFSSPINALDHLQSLKNHNNTFPHVIFLDIHMPQMDGFGFLDKYLEFAEDIREHCKVVMLSSTDADRDHARMKEYPIIYKFISKPMSHKSFNDITALWKDSKIRLTH